MNPLRDMIRLIARKPPNSSKCLIEYRPLKSHKCMSGLLIDNPEETFEKLSPTMRKKKSYTVGKELIKRHHKISIFEFLDKIITSV